MKKVEIKSFNDWMNMLSWKVLRREWRVEDSNLDNIWWLGKNGIAYDNVKEEYYYLWN